MKKWYLFILCNALTSRCFSFPESKQEVRKKEVRANGTYEQFALDLERYYIEPGWVILSFLSLPLDEFDKAWELFITILQHNPWKFFVGKPQSYSEKKYRESFITQCELYDIFLINLLVDLSKKKLFVVVGSEKTEQLKKKGVVTIFQYWQLKKETLHHHFYAFYFDRIIMQLYETVITASCQLDMSDYPELYKQVRKYGTRLSSIFKQLKGGPYDDRYAYHVKRYQEVLELLRKERNLVAGELDAC